MTRSVEHEVGLKIPLWALGLYRLYCCDAEQFARGGVEFYLFGKVRRAWDCTLEGKFGDFSDGIDISFEFVAIDKSLKLQRSLRIVPCGR